ncbi:MAG: hypothetical protein Q7S83_00610 [bacterium]|nr:hypothetical protein [bacterium]
MFIKLFLAVPFILLAFAVALFYIHFGGSGNLLVVRLDSVRGINFISQVGEVWGTLAVVLAINVVNFLLTLGLLKRDRKIAVLLPFTSTLISLLILIYISVIVSVN